MIDRKIKIQSGLPFLAIMISLSLIKLVNFKPELTPFETRMFGLVAEKIDMREMQPFSIEGDIKSPMEIVKQQPKEFPMTPLSSVAPQSPAEAEKIIKPDLKVSMIVVSDSRRMAIINGMVVKEGDSVGDSRISRIEKNRILLTEHEKENKENKTRWLYLEGK